jgi:hypothetical protein
MKKKTSRQVESAVDQVVDAMRAAVVFSTPHVRRALLGQRRVWTMPKRQEFLAATLAAKVFAHLVLAGLLGYFLLRHLPFGALLTFLASVLSAVFVIGWLAAGRTDAEPSGDWWSEKTLLSALQRAKVVPPTKKDDPAPPVVRRLGKPKTDERGTTVRIALPSGVYGDLVKAHDHFAAGLGVRADRLHVVDAPGTPPHTVDITVVDREAPPRRPVVEDATEHTWADGVELGANAWFQTRNTHSVIAGASGSGKTRTARLVVGAAALDPGVRLYLVDGKGDAGSAGWEAVVPRCERALIGVGPDDLDELVSILQEVVDLSAERGRAGRSAPEVVLVVEEIAALQSVCDKGTWAEVDRLLRILLSTSRSRGVHCIVVSQRGTVDSVPPIVRANSSQRLVGQFTDSKETGYVLEALPSVLPSQPGEFLLRNDRTPVPTVVRVDDLQDRAWTALCGRAAARRGERTCEPAEELSEAKSASELTELQAAAAELLAVEPLPASGLRPLLPDEMRPETDRLLGVALSKRPDVFEQRKTHGGRYWHRRATVAAPSRTPVGTVAAPPRTAAPPPRTPEIPRRAEGLTPHTQAQSALPPAPSTEENR